MQTTPQPHAYRSPTWLRGGHLQTIFPALFAKIPQLDYQRERWELADGDFVDVDWATPKVYPEAGNSQPVVALFHGLEGSAQSHYAKAVMHAVTNKGWTGVVIHFRGCSGEDNRLPRFYYAGESAEIQRLLSRLSDCLPKRPIYAVGFSLGGNALLKWMGEYAEQASRLISKAAAVSAPFDLEASAITLDKGLNRVIYTPMFVSSIKKKALRLAKRYPNLLNIKQVKAAKTIHDIDNAVTAVLHGAHNAQDYYSKNSAKPWLKHIQLPTLVLNAKNDPFLPAQYLPKPNEVSSPVHLEYTQHGGHVGFANDPFPSEINWLPERLIRFFEERNELVAK